MRYLIRFIVLVFGLTSFISCKSVKDDGQATLGPPPSNSLKFSTGICEYTGVFDTTQYSLTQLENTFNSWFRGLQFGYGEVPHDLEGIDAVDTIQLDKKYNSMRTAFLQAEIVNDPFWNDIKEKRLNEFENEYNLTRLTIIAYGDPSKLLAGMYSGICTEFSIPLASNDSSQLVTLWKKVNQKEFDESADSKYWEKFERKLNSKEWLLHAKIDLITYGWHNCVNDTFEHLSVNQKMLDEYKKLFKTVTEVCED